MRAHLPTVLAQCQVALRNTFVFFKAFGGLNKFPPNQGNDIEECSDIEVDLDVLHPTCEEREEKGTGQ